MTETHTEVVYNSFCWTKCSLYIDLVAASFIACHSTIFNYPAFCIPLSSWCSWTRKSCSISVNLLPSFCDIPYHKRKSYLFLLLPSNVKPAACSSLWLWYTTNVPSSPERYWPAKLDTIHRVAEGIVLCCVCVCVCVCSRARMCMGVSSISVSLLLIQPSHARQDRCIICLKR